MRYTTRISIDNINNFVMANGDDNIIHTSKDEAGKFLSAIKEKHEEGVIAQGAWSLAKLEYLPQIVDHNIKWAKINFQSPLVINDEKEIEFEIEKIGNAYKIELTENKRDMKKVIITAEIGFDEKDINEKVSSLEKKINENTRENEAKLNDTIEIKEDNFNAYLRSIGITEDDYFRKHEGVSGVLASIFIPARLVHKFRETGSEKEPGHLIYKIQRSIFNGKNSYSPLNLFGKIISKRKENSEVYSSDIAIAGTSGEPAVYSNCLSAKILDKVCA